jgi:hypothetical protein
MMKEMKTGAFTYNNEPYNFEFKTSLSAYEKQVFVKTVVDNLVSENSYDVVIKDLVFDFAIIELFTNIDTSFINMKDDDGDDIPQIILVEHFLENTNVADIVKEGMEFGLLENLNRAVELNIQYLTGIRSNPLSEAVAKLVSTIEKKVNDVDLSAAMDMMQKFANMNDDFTVENIVNAYMNSDVHKDNLAQIAESKK